ncbi:23.6 kDa heat shock protein, mitochondrial-like [Cornus florida]|uniref:23.6 kDa heat shock protein, mitochondrial-like n=1 Tax=Cornus florida TaxID=4283 RepID=UPI002896F255|nr:23.6 kDa heat shock protein, mitochondrial-like [Cornus florida]
MKEGSSPIPYKVVKDEKAMYARWDMPGMGIEGLKMWIENNTLHVNGEEKEEEEEEEEGKSLSALGRRKYSGDMDIPQGCYKVEEIAADLKNGVLNVKIPKREDIINVQANRSSFFSVVWIGNKRSEILRLRYVIFIFVFSKTKILNFDSFGAFAFGLSLLVTCDCFNGPFVDPDWVVLGQRTHFVAHILYL